MALITSDCGAMLQFQQQQRSAVAIQSQYRGLLARRHEAGFQYRAPAPQRGEVTEMELRTRRRSDDAASAIQSRHRGNRSRGASRLQLGLRAKQQAALRLDPGPAARLPFITSFIAPAKEAARVVAVSPPDPGPAAAPPRRKSTQQRVGGRMGKEAEEEMIEVDAEAVTSWKGLDSPARDGDLEDNVLTSKYSDHVVLARQAVLLRATMSAIKIQAAWRRTRTQRASGTVRQ